jgi:hypothetical protein
MLFCGKKELHVQMETCLPAERGLEVPGTMESFTFLHFM